MEDLENRGVQVIHSEDELEGLSGGTVVIRSHGVSRDVCEKIEARGMKIVDATCPFVKKIHRIVDEEGRKRPPRRHHRKRGSSGGTGHHGMGERPGYRDAYRRRSGKFCARKMENQYLLWHRRHLITTNFKDLVEIFLKKSYDSTVLKTNLQRYRGKTDGSESNCQEG